MEIVYPSGRIVTYARDALGRVTQVTTRAGEFAAPLVLAQGIAYLPFGPMTALDYGNGLGQSRDYDQDYRLAALATGGAGPAVQDLAYAYDPAGNVTAIGDALDAGRSQTFAYGALARLSEARGLYGEIAYSYDANGNRLSRRLSGGSVSAEETYAYEAGSNRLAFVSGGGALRELGTDESGNIVADLRADGRDFAYGYNAGGRLSQVTLNGVPLALYLYDAFGRRAVKEVAGGGLPRRSAEHRSARSTEVAQDAGRWENRPGERPAALDERGERGMEGSGTEALHFLYSPTGGLLAEYNAATGAVTREYVSLDGQPLALIADGQVLAVHPDRLGAPQAMTDASGAVVWQASLRPFGEAEDLFEAASNDQRFPGQRLDAETGLHQNWFRDYDPSLGRYLQADPIGLAGGLNVYAYAGGNPVNRIDPDGLEGLVIGDRVSNNLNTAPPGQLLFATGLLLSPIVAPLAAASEVAGIALLGFGVGSGLDLAGQAAEFYLGDRSGGICRSEEFEPDFRQTFTSGLAGAFGGSVAVGANRAGQFVALSYGRLAGALSELGLNFLGGATAGGANAYVNDGDVVQGALLTGALGSAGSTVNKLGGAVGTGLGLGVSNFPSFVLF